MGQSNGVEKYLKALAHPVRRKVLTALAREKSLSYTELMKISGVEDSGTFAFHLRMLQGLIEKDPSTGEYRLTEEGYRAYKALKILYGGESDVEEASRGEEKHSVEEVRENKEGKEEVVVISDKLSFDLTRKLAEKLASEGKKLLITDVVTVNIEDMPEELLDRVLEGIQDVLVVNVPNHLKHVIDLKGRDVFITGKSVFGGFIGGLVKTIVSAVASSLGKIPIQAISKKEKIHLKITEKVPEEYSIKTTIDASKISFSKTSGREIVVDGDFYKGSEPELSIQNSTAVLDIDVGSAKIMYPSGLKELKLDADASSIDGVIESNNLRDITVRCDASNIDLEFRNLGETVFRIDADASNIDLRLDYAKFKGLSELIIEGDVSNITINMSINEETKVQAIIEEGVGSIELNGYTGRHYIDKDYENASSKLKIIVRNESGNTRIKINRKPK